MTKLLEEAIARTSELGAKLSDQEQEKLAVVIIGMLEGLKDMDVDEFEDFLELKNQEVRAHIRESHKEYRDGKSRPAEDFLAELEAENKKGTNPS